MQKSTTLFYVTLFFSIFQLSCQKEIVIPERTVVDKSYILNENLFECNNYETFEPTIPIEPLLGMHDYQNYHCFYTKNQLIIKEKNTDITRFQTYVNVNKLITYGSKLVVCADQGILTLNQTLQDDIITNVSCIDMEIGLNNELLFVTKNSTDAEPRRIHQLELETSTITPYTDKHQGECAAIKDFILIKDVIWAKTCDGTIVKFQNDILSEHFNDENSPLNKELNAHQIFMLAHDNQLILVSKNGEYYYQISKYSNENWAVIKEIEYDISQLAKDKSMEGTALKDAIMVNDYLYITTLEEECEGVHRFDLSQAGTLGTEDYQVVQDPSLPLSCIQQVYQAADETLYLLMNNGQIVSIKC